MRSIYLGARAARDIDIQVEKILRGLDYPSPPIRLKDVRELLRLDLRYYSSTNDGIIREVVHRLKLGGKQLIARPTLLVDVIRKFDLKALYVPDRKRILIDEDLPMPKHRWNEGHEVAHSIIPWHKEFMLGDDTQTLSRACLERIEAEANYGAAGILFPIYALRDVASTSNLSLQHVREVAKDFGNTITSTLWTCIEASSIPMVGLVSDHPRHPTYPEGDVSARHLICSRPFQAQFATTGELKIFECLKSYVSWTKRGPLGASEVILVDVNGEEHVFDFESFSNGYDVLTLGVYKTPRNVMIAVS